MTSEHPWRDESVLRELHHDKELCMAEIGRRLECDPQTVSRWLNRHDIEVRSNSHAAAGEDHHNSKSAPPRDYNGEWGSVRYRFRQTRDVYCQRCGENNLPDHRYHLHHDNESDGRDTNAGDVNMGDITPLCPSCHTSVEVNGFSLDG